VAPRPAPSTRWLVAAFIGALAVPALILLGSAVVSDPDRGTLLAARAGGAIAFSLLAVAVWFTVVRRR